MNKERAKQILLLYRPGAGDGDDPEMRQALEFAREDAELRRWFEDHCAVQLAIRARIREIAPPNGLKEQILSERPASKRLVPRPIILVYAAAVAAMLLGLLIFWPKPSQEDAFAIYRSRMMGKALRGYAMDFETNDLAQINAFLARNRAPADYNLPNGLRSAPVTGCASQTWQGAKVAMICFRTGKPLPPGDKSDLWLFVIGRDLVKDAPGGVQPRIVSFNNLITAAWTRGNNLYLLGTRGNKASDLAQYF